MAYVFSFQSAEPEVRKFTGNICNEIAPTDLYRKTKQRPPPPGVLPEAKESDFANCLAGYLDIAPIADAPFQVREVDYSAKHRVWDLYAVLNGEPCKTDVRHWYITKGTLVLIESKITNELRCVN